MGELQRRGDSDSRSFTDVRTNEAHDYCIQLTGMSTLIDNQGSADPFDLNRFVEAQEADYSTALSELRAGHKRTHWMWYIFPRMLRQYPARWLPG